MIVVGHNPGLGDLAAGLAGAGPRAARDRLALEFPTAAYAVIDFAGDLWAEIAPGRGRLERFVCAAGHRPGSGRLTPQATGTATACASTSAWLGRGEPGTKASKAAQKSCRIASRSVRISCRESGRTRIWPAFSRAAKRSVSGVPQTGSAPAATIRSAA